MVIRYLTIVFLFIFITIGNIGGCGGDGENCINFSSFFNGQDAQTQTSVWECVAGEDFFFSFAVFEDGMGVTTALGIGEFEFETGCRTLDLQSALGTGSLNFQGPIEGDVEVGEAMFDDVLVVFDDVELGTFDIFCLLDTTPEDTL